MRERLYVASAYVPRETRRGELVKEVLRGAVELLVFVLLIAGIVGSLVLIAAASDGLPVVSL